VRAELRLRFSSRKGQPEPLRVKGDLVPNDPDDLDAEDLRCAGLMRADRRNLFREFDLGREGLFTANKPSSSDVTKRAGGHGRRNPSIAALIKRVEKSGREVTSVTLPDGTKLNFGEPDATTTSNDLDKWIAKHASETERH
jgi:hypothetical protein